MDSVILRFDRSTGKADPLKYTLSKICSILGADYLGNEELREYEVRQVLIDSRKVKSGGSGGIFWAIRTDQNDGHRYIKEAYLLGVRAFAVSVDPGSVRDLPDAAFLVVPDTLAALQSLALHHRSQFDIPTIGITGSNGKTIVKEWLYQLIGPGVQVVKSPKSFNSQIGVPLSVLNIGEDHQLGIFEAGISQPGEMQQLASIIDPALVILTNIGPAHDAGFRDREQKLTEKLALAVNAANILYCKGHGEIDRLLRDDPRGVSWGYDDTADINFMISRSGSQTLVKLRMEEGEVEFRVPFSDRASVENACHCLATLMLLDYDMRSVQKRVIELRNVPMRLEMKYGANNCTIIDDTYSADMDSLKIALEFMDEQPTLKQRTLVISEFIESGTDDETFIGQLAELARSYGIKKMVGVGQVFKQYHDKLTTLGFEYRAYKNTEDLLEHTGYDSFNNELILLKGARSHHFEDVVRKLQLQSHRTVLEISLNSLVNNLKMYRKFIKGETGVIAMVKAFSYGAGSVEIASILEKRGVEGLAVAFADEGVRLRRAGIRCRIIVMNAGYDELSLLLDHRLEPEVYSLEMLKELRDRFSSGSYGSSQLGIHLKLDTGMHRLGILEEEIDEAIEIIKGSAHLRILSVFSHLAAAEDAAFDQFTFQQLQLFKQLSARLIESFDHAIMRHILNSAGVIRFTGAQYDWVRLGIGMYGIDTTSSIQERLEPVGTLKTHITQIKNVKKGATIGYGRKGQALNDMKMAVLPIGYADGLDRRLSNGKGEVFLKGKKARIVGNICMDLTMIDVSSVDDPQPGDEVEIYGKHISIVDAAARAGTIPYELLTNISERVKRIYVKD